MDRRVTTVFSRLLSELRGVWTPLVTSIRTHVLARPRRYRPERYYMRGPGPKCYERNTLGFIRPR